MPTLLNAIYNEVFQLLRQQQYEEALDRLQQIETDETRFLYAWIHCLTQLGRIEEALAYCERLHATHSDPRIPVLAPKIHSKEPLSETIALSELTLLYTYEEAGRLFRRERYAEALEVLDAAEPQTHPEFVYARAQCLGLVGRIDDAVACCDFLEHHCHDHRGATLRNRLCGGVRGNHPNLFPNRPEPVSAVDQTLKEILSERDQLREMLKQQRTALVAATQRLAEFGDSGPALLQQVRALATDIEYSRAQAKALEEARAEREHLRDTIDQQRESLESTSKRIAEIKAINTSLHQQNQALIQERELQQKQAKAMMQASDSIRQERDQFKGAVDQQRTNLEGAAQLITELKATINALQQQNQEKDVELAKIREKMITTGQNAALMASERDRLQETVEQQEANLQSSTRVMTEIKTAYATLQQQIQDLTNERDQARSQALSSAPALMQTQAERDQLAGLLEQLKQEKNQLMQHMAEREALVASQQQYISTLQHMTDVLTADVERFRNQEAAASQALEAACMERDHFRRILDQRALADTHLPQRLTDNEIVTAALQKQIIALAEEVTPLFASVRASLNQLAQEVARIETERIRTTADTESRAAKRRRNLLATPPPMHFSGNAIETIYTADETNRSENLRRRRD